PADDPRLRRHPRPAELLGGLLRERRPLHTGGELAQLGEVGRERRVVRRARGAEPETPGAPALGPYEHLAGPSPPPSEPQAGGRHLVAQPRGVSPELAGAERRAHPLHGAEPGPECRLGAAAVAAAQAKERLGVPGTGAPVAETGAPSTGRQGELTGGEARPP